MKISLSTTTTYSGVDTILLPLFEGDRVNVAKLGTVFSAVAKSLPQLAKSGAFERKIGSSFVVPAADKTPNIILVGMGKAKECDSEKFRQAGGAAVGLLGSLKSKSCGIAHYHKNIEAGAIVEGLVLGSYKFEKYKSEPSKDGLKSCKVFSADKSIKKSIDAAVAMAEATNWARDLGNTPGLDLTPTALVKEARSLAKKTNSKISVLNEAKMAALGMNSLLAVSKGSKEPAYLMSLFYKSSAKAPTIALVGKGLTFDSGGISLKPGANMQDMKFDMCGSAAVLGAFKAICALKPKVNVICVVPTSENMPGPQATRPGDIVKAYNGKTVEIYNTDAEGRLILADALAYTVKKYKPDTIINVATLTGACIAALGHIAAGIMSNDDAVAKQLEEAATVSGEKVWQLPLWQEYADMIKGHDADLCNIASQAGTITAGCFLKEFVGETPWAHVDIAGMAWNVGHLSYHPKRGATGYGVRLLTELVQNLEK